DGGLLLDVRRHLLTAADMAALAAASDLYLHYGPNQGLDPNGTAKDSAKDAAQANGFDSRNSTIAVHIPASAGPFANQRSYAEVIIQYKQKRYFSGIFGKGDVPVSARAVARATLTPPLAAGILVLDPSSAGSFAASGTVQLKTNAPLIIDSNSAQAATAT